MPCFDVLIVGLLLFLGLGMFAYYRYFPELLPEGLPRNGAASLHRPTRFPTVYQGY